jgi:hypothetical protein
VGTSRATDVRPRFVVDRSVWPEEVYLVTGVDGVADDALYSVPPVGSPSLLLGQADLPFDWRSVAVSGGNVAISYAHGAEASIACASLGAPVFSPPGFTDTADILLATAPDGPVWALIGSGAGGAASDVGVTQFSAANCQTIPGPASWALLPQSPYAVAFP